MNLLFLAAEEGGFHVPPLDELFEFPPFLFEESQYFAFNRTALLYLVAAAIVSGLFVYAFRNPDVVPGKFQGVIESIVEFIREQIVIQVIGPDGLRFVPLLTAIFMFVWVNNFFEVTPLVQFPSTGRMAVPAFLAIVVWLIYLLVGMKAQGVVGFWKGALLGVEMPAAVRIIYIPVELAQLVIVRPLTLAIRLFANMMAGHILLAVIFIAANAFLIDVHSGLTDLVVAPEGPLGLLLGVVTAFAIGPAMVAFEIMVGALQAYIFTILTAVYIGGSLHPEH
ncbi:MAG: F0F1 ATP synthase subunit A [Nitriliruptorales bacterium]|nr:F0F1 ATP synthase subunit A [Nitriliruptorales bacterium]